MTRPRQLLAGRAQALLPPALTQPWPPPVDARMDDRVRELAAYNDVLERYVAVLQRSNAALLAMVAQVQAHRDWVCCTPEVIANLDPKDGLLTSLGSLDRVQIAAQAALRDEDDARRVFDGAREYLA